LCLVGAFVFAVKDANHCHRQGNMVQTLAQWRHPMAASRTSCEALDVFHQAMCHALYRHIHMVIKIACN
jgi:hypothetical protein